MGAVRCTSSHPNRVTISPCLGFRGYERFHGSSRVTPKSYSTTQRPRAPITASDTQPHPGSTMNPTSQVLNPKAAAVYLGVSIDMLYEWRRFGNGPRYLIWGRRTIRYRVSDLDAWLASQPTAGNIAEANRLLSVS
ncbi:helix-turn-helix transcriptional regulator [Mesoterricola sediminis]|uniref:helix-turn-helix transcriptional regulator n=1 Tax=Mesoterricola sediminis TaxID=2927980 RepID=UPI0037432309